MSALSQGGCEGILARSPLVAGDLDPVPSPPIVTLGGVTSFWAQLPGLSLGSRVGGECQVPKAIPIQTVFKGAIQQPGGHPTPYFPWPLLILPEPSGCLPARGPAHLSEIISWPRHRPDLLCPCSSPGISALAVLLPGTLAWLTSSHFPVQRPRSPSPSCPRRVKKPHRTPAPHYCPSQCIFFPVLSTP